jgi:hypothetical protein
MKISQSHFIRYRRQDGSVVFIFVALLAIMMILVAANGNALSNLHKETKLLEHRQIERLNDSQTNAITVVELPAKPESK